ncbi:MAG: response regulator [Thermodesulfobacteriota bacterium]
MEFWVLVIDDDAGTREALADILGRAGYGVVSWAGDAPLEDVFLSQTYRVAVVDYHLPSFSGLEIAQRLKELQPECRIILISSEFPHLAEAVADAPVVDRFLAKPFSKDTILEVIAQLCSTGAG